MSENAKISWKQMGVVMAMMVAIGSVMAAHISGVDSAVSRSKVYTDTKVDPLYNRLDRIETKQDRMIEMLGR